MGVLGSPPVLGAPGFALRTPSACPTQVPSSLVPEEGWAASPGAALLEGGSAVTKALLSPVSTAEHPGVVFCVAGNTPHFCCFTVSPKRQLQFLIEIILNL